MVAGRCSKLTEILVKGLFQGTSLETLDVSAMSTIAGHDHKLCYITTTGSTSGSHATGNVEIDLSKQGGPAIDGEIDGKDGRQ